MKERGNLRGDEEEGAGQGQASGKAGRGGVSSARGSWGRRAPSLGLALLPRLLAPLGGRPPLHRCFLQLLDHSSLAASGPSPLLFQRHFPRSLRKAPASRTVPTRPQNPLGSSLLNMLSVRLAPSKVGPPPPCPRAAEAGGIAERVLSVAAEQVAALVVLPGALGERRAPLLPRFPMAELSLLPKQVGPGPSEACRLSQWISWPQMKPHLQNEEERNRELEPRVPVDPQQSFWVAGAQRLGLRPGAA